MTYDTRMPEAIAMDSGDPEADDEQIAETIADFLLAMYSWRWYCLSTYEYYSPCSTPHDWRRKTAVGVNTRDRAHARQWAIDALLDGGHVRRTIGPETWSHWEPILIISGRPEPTAEPSGRPASRWAFRLGGSGEERRVDVAGGTDFWSLGTWTRNGLR